MMESKPGPNRALLAAAWGAIGGAGLAMVVLGSGDAEIIVGAIWAVCGVPAALINAYTVNWTAQDARRAPAP
jgi:hypothetical protein